jgi:hypothetical protein
MHFVIKKKFFYEGRLYKPGEEADLEYTLIVGDFEARGYLSRIGAPLTKPEPRRYGRRDMRPKK